MFSREGGIFECPPLLLGGRFTTMIWDRLRLGIALTTYFSAKPLPLVRYTEWKPRSLSFDSAWYHKHLFCDYVMIMILLRSLNRYLYLTNNVRVLKLRVHRRCLSSVEQSLLISFTLSPLLKIGRAKKANLKFIAVVTVVADELFYPAVNLTH